jgi:hypothetical protein
MEPNPFSKAPSMSSLLAGNMMIPNLKKQQGIAQSKKTVSIAKPGLDSPSRREQFQSSQAFAASKSHHHIGVQKRKNSSSHNDLRTIKNKVNRALRQFIVNIDHSQSSTPNSTTLREIASKFIKTTETQI